MFLYIVKFTVNNEDKHSTCSPHSYVINYVIIKYVK